MVDGYLAQSYTINDLGDLKKPNIRLLHFDPYHTGLHSYYVEWSENQYAGKVYYKTSWNGGWFRLLSSYQIKKDCLF